MPIRETRHNNRNPVARAAILRKGGVHEKCRTSKRQQQKRELEDAISAYYTSDEKDSDHDNGSEPIRSDHIRGSNHDRGKGQIEVAETAEI